MHQGILIKVWADSLDEARRAVRSALECSCRDGKDWDTGSFPDLRIFSATRLKGDKFDAGRLTKENDSEDPYDKFAYYVKFGEFCRRCAERGGFKIW